MFKMLNHISRRIFSAPNAEASQAAIVRPLSGGIVNLYVWAIYPEGAWQIGATMGVWLYMLIGAMVILSWMYRQPVIAPKRYFLAIFIDISGLTMAIYINNEYGLALYPLYMWIAFGYGLRFGRRYLLICALFSSASFLLLWFSMSSLHDRGHHYMFTWYTLGLLLVPLYGAILLKKLDEAKTLEDKLLQTEAIAGNIAHELRTPLTTIAMTAKNFGKYLPDLWTGYDLGLELASTSGRRANFFIPAHRRKLLKSGVENIGDTARQAHAIISLLLTNIRNEDIDEACFECYAMQSCIERTLSDYPLRDDELDKIHVSKNVDFNFKGIDTLFIYVLYNLIKNALYFIARAGKGEIQIWLIRGEDVNRVHFRDTGTGIPASVLPNIFTPFYTTKDMDVGNGLGLAFCQRVIKGFNGQIQCHSVEGEYTEFVIQLPSIGS